MTNEIADEKPKTDNLKPGEYRVRVHGKGTGIQINKKIDTETTRRILNVLMQEDFRK